MAAMTPKEVLATLSLHHPVARPLRLRPLSPLSKGDQNDVH